MTCTHDIRWKTLKNMLPGSELNKIKEINEKLVKTSTLLTLCIGASRFEKRCREKMPKEKASAQNGKRKKKEEKMMIDTLLTIPIGTLEMSTLPDPGSEMVPIPAGKPVFMLKFMGDPNLLEIARKNELDEIRVSVESPEFVIERAKFMEFPKEIISRISMGDK